MHFSLPTITSLAAAVKTYGHEINPRGVRTTELLGISATWPLGTYPSRVKMPKRLASVEGVSLIAGHVDFGLIKTAAPNVDLQLFEQSAQYSVSIRRQLPRVLAGLKRDPATRRAILYFSRIGDTGTSKTACLSTLQFLIRAGKLHLVLHVRSWDLAWGLPIDVVAVSILGLAVARVFGVLPGILHCHAASLHLYDSSAHRAVSGVDDLGAISINFDRVAYTWTKLRAEAQSHMNKSAWEWVTVR